MLKFGHLSLVALLTFPATAFAQASGNAAEGEKNFRQCASCHGIVAPDGTVTQRLAPTGPNLWGVAGRGAGTYDGYARYSGSIKAAGEAGVVWDEASFVAFVSAPTDFLKEATGDARARSNMNHRLRGSAEDLYAYLAQFGAN